MVRYFHPFFRICIICIVVVCKHVDCCYPVGFVDAKAEVVFIDYRTELKARAI